MISADSVDPVDRVVTKRILTLSDKVEPLLYGPGLKRVVGDVDLVLSCGDLPDYYLDYVVSMLNVPCYFVHGNHAQGAEFRCRDPEQLEKEHKGLPSACNVSDRVVCEGGLLIAGLDGSMRYNRNPRYQYTEGQMCRRVLRMVPLLLWNRLRHGRYLDILMTHAPPFGIHHGPDLCHRGFRAFLPFMRWFRPRFLVHGHTHVYRSDEVTTTLYQDTKVINSYGYRIVEVSG
jgi:Icc-related predicted phosphoesterase